MCAIGAAGKLNRIGMEACRRGNFQEAEHHLLRALEQVLSAGSLCHQAKVHNNLGILYELRADHEKAHHHYNSALTIMREKLSTDHPLYSRMMQSLTRVSQTN